MNAEIIYKGITIVTVTDAAVGGADSTVYIAIGKEYGSMAAAKGAVTRWVNANVEAVQKHDDDVIVSDTHGQPVQFTSAKNGNGEPIAANPKTAHVYAEMDYYGMAKAHDTRSRNKREGGYCGRYKAGVKGFKMANYRVGPKGDYETLKQRSAWFKKWN